MEEKIAIATIGTEIYRTEVKAGKHLILADEPEAAGGKDIGPRPGDFLRMSLASCTAITLRMYADRKHFDVKQILVTVSSKEAERGTVFNTKVEIIGTINQQQRERMLQIARLCPLHKVLTSPIEIDTVLSVTNN